MISRHGMDHVTVAGGDGAAAKVTVRGPAGDRAEPPALSKTSKANVSGPSGAPSLNRSALHDHLPSEPAVVAVQAVMGAPEPHAILKTTLVKLTSIKVVGVAVSVRAEVVTFAPSAGATQ
jgi:hypothetical protein